MLLGHHDSQTHSTQVAGQQPILDDSHRGAAGMYMALSEAKPSAHVEMPSAQLSSDLAANVNVPIVAPPCNTTTDEH